MKVFPVLNFKNTQLHCGKNLDVVTCSANNLMSFSSQNKDVSFYGNNDVSPIKMSDYWLEEKTSLFRQILLPSENYDLKRYIDSLLKTAIYNKSGNVDCSAISFLENIVENDESMSFTPDDSIVLLEFINFAKDKEGVFRDSLGKYYDIFKKNSSGISSIVKTMSVDENNLFVEEKLKQAQEILSIAEKQPCIEYLSHKVSFLSLVCDKNLKFQQNLLDSFFELTNRFPNAKFNDLCSILKACKNEDETLNSEAFVALGKVLEHSVFRLGWSHLDKDNNKVELVNYPSIAELIELINNKDGSIDSELLNKMIKNKKNLDLLSAVKLYNGISLFSSKKNNDWHYFFNVNNTPRPKLIDNKKKLFFSQNYDNIVKIYKDFEKYKSTVSDKRSYPTLIASLLKANADLSLDFDYINFVEKSAQAFGLGSATTLLAYFNNDVESIEYNNFIKLLNKAKSGEYFYKNTQNLTESDIISGFCKRINTITDFISILGAETFEAALKLNFEQFIELLDNFFKYNCLSIIDQANLVKKLNPKSSSRYQDNQREITKLKVKLSSLLSDEQKVQESELNQTINNLKKEVNNLKFQLSTTEDKNSAEYIRAEINTKNKQVNNLRYRIKSFYQSDESKTLMAKITSLQKAQSDIIANSWQDKFAGVLYLKSLFDLSDCFDDSDVSFFIKNVDKKSPEDKKDFANFFESKLMDKFSETVDEDVINMCDFQNNKYFIKLLITNQMQEINNLLTIISNHPQKSIQDSLNELPQNKLTRTLFNKNNLDYDSWVGYNPESFVTVSVSDELSKSIQFICNKYKNLINSSVIQKFPQAEQDELFNIFKSSGFSLVDNSSVKYFDINSRTVSIKDLKLLTQKVQDLIGSRQFWYLQTDNIEINKFKKTFKFIVSEQQKQLDFVERLNKLNNQNLQIRKANMNDIGYSLFLGNYSGCCTAIGHNVNQYSAPNYIKNKIISAIELVADGKPVGNTMCYVAEVRGKQSLILDNFECQANYHFVDSIKDALIEYAKKLCSELGRPDMSIYAGANRQKFHFGDLKYHLTPIKVLGSTGDDNIYLDICSGTRQLDPDSILDCNLLKLA